MTLLLLEGFDDYATSSLWSRATVVGQQRTVLGTGRTGPGYLNGQSGSGATYQVAGADEHATFAFGMGYYRTSVAAKDIVSLRSDNGATEHVVLRLNANGSLSVDRGATVLDTTDPGIIANTVWNYLELEALLSDTVGTIKVWVNGALLINLSATDTKNAGTKTVFDSFFLDDGATGTWKDDIYLTNGAGSLNVGRMGEIKVETKFMNGNGNYSQLVGSDADSTDNYLQVDETGGASSTDYNGSATDGQIDTYTVEDLTIPSGTIFGAEVRMYAAKTDAGAKSIRHVHRGGATDSAGTDRTLATSYATYYDILEQYPNGPATWTVTNFNASEFGAEVRP